MAEEDLDPDWTYEMPFYLAAALAYGIVVMVNPTVRWGTAQAPVERIAPIEFVALPPAPPQMLPAPPAEMRPAAPKPKSKSKIVSKIVRKIRRRVTVNKKAIMAALAARQARLAHLKALREEAAKAARARAQALREEKARRAALARAEALRRAEAAREKLARLAAEKAAKVRKRAELSQELATMPNPDEVIAQGSDSELPSEAAAPPQKLASDKSAATALVDSAEPSEGDAFASPGALLGAKSENQAGPIEAEGVSYFLDGPVGNRRILKRVIPVSPDWVGTRGLALAVTVRFQLLPDGTVAPGAVIVKTSGFPDIDRRALDALKLWRFEPAPSGDGSKVWGRVTFRFTS